MGSDEQVSEANRPASGRDCLSAARVLSAVSAVAVVAMPAAVLLMRSLDHAGRAAGERGMAILLVLLLFLVAAAAAWVAGVGFGVMAFWALRREAAAQAAVRRMMLWLCAAPAVMAGMMLWAAFTRSP